MPDESEDNAILILEIGYYDAADARTSGTAIERLANAFAQETRSGRNRYGLEIVRVEIASLHAWFDLGKTLLALYDQRALFGGFLQGVAVALETVMSAGGNVGQISASVRTFLVSLAAPIVRKQASHAKLYVKGDNNTIIYIENLHAERIDQLFEAGRRARGGGGFIPERVDTELLRRWQEGEILGPKLGPNDSMHETATVVDRANLLQREAAEIVSSLRKDSVPPPPPGESQATLLNIAGQWYARPAGFQGVMLPVEKGSVAEEGLFEAKTYTASGIVVREGGNPTVFRVRTAVVNRS